MDPKTYGDASSEWVPEDMNWDELADPTFYEDQAKDWGYDAIIAESGMPMEYNSDTNSVEWNQEKMRQDFRDYMGWAIMGDVWDSRQDSTCADRCN